MTRENSRVSEKENYCREKRFRTVVGIRELKKKVSRQIKNDSLQQTKNTIVFFLIIHGVVVTLKEKKLMLVS